MGFELARFVGAVDEELICPICSGVLDEPVQTPDCEHAFCTVCIHEWLTLQSICPVDRSVLINSQLRPVARILRNMLHRLQISCDNSNQGCSAIVRLEFLDAHYNECEFNPVRPVSCPSGCGLILPKNEANLHNCIRDLRFSVDAITDLTNSIREELSALRAQLNDHRRECISMVERMKHMSFSQSSVVSTNIAVLQRSITDQSREEEATWAASLSRARVTRWGGMISTPDRALQDIIKQSLIDSGCPRHIVDELIENSHERRWPSGLLTLETRQMNRCQYENYLCRRIPNKHAVVIMWYENSGMPADLILQPGIIMIFAHGIE